MSGNAQYRRTRITGLIDPKVPKPFDANLIAGLQLWWAATAVIGKNNGDTVTSIPNLATATGAPVNGSAYLGSAIFKTNAYNGKPALTFAGDESFSYAQIDTATVFWVMKHLGNGYLLPHGSNYYYVTRMPASTLDTDYSYVPLRNGVWRNKGVSYGPTSAPHTTGALTILSCRIAAGSTAPANRFGEDRGTGNRWNGDLCELLAYNTRLSDADMRKVEKYLVDKWAVPGYVTW